MSDQLTVTAWGLPATRTRVQALLQKVIDLDYGENGAAEALWGDEVKSCN